MRSAALGLTDRGVAWGRRHRRLRRALLALVVCLPLLAGGWLWLRDSPLVSVESVQVSGVHGPDARAIEAALSNAARHMSTLDVHIGALRAAVAPFRVVRDVGASSSFPHGLHIDVVEQPPVAALVVGGSRVAVAADGVVLGPALLSGSLPTLGGASEPISVPRLKSPSLLAALTVVGVAPAALARFMARVYEGPKGLTVAMRNGLLAYFGDASRPHAKWTALARVLADPSAAGASYVDVRLPGRPAAGFAAGTAPPGTTASGTTASNSEQTGTPQPTSGSESAAALAAGLAAAVGGSSSGTAPSGSAATETGPANPAEATSSAPSRSAAEGQPSTPAAEG